MKIHTVLAARSDFSIGESTLSIDKLLDTAKSVGATAVALADTMTVSGIIDFSRKAKELGIQPIIGVRLRVVQDATLRDKKVKNNPEFYPKLYARNEAGMRRIFRLLTLANSEDRFFYVPRLSLDDVLNELHADDLCASLGDTYSAIHSADAREIAEKFSAHLTRSQTFLELCPIRSPLWDTVNAKGLTLARELGLQTLVTYPAFYPEGGADDLDVLNAITRNVKMKDPWTYQPVVRDFSIKRPEELVKLTSEARERVKTRIGPAGAELWKQGLLNGEKLASLCGYVWEKSAPSLPKLAPDEDAALKALCVTGWKNRFSKPQWGHKPTTEELREVYAPRLKYELEVLQKMGFAGYFLLVQDVVDWSKRNGIAVGPGRGSVGGSLVAYLIGITDCDPIRFNLLFERFINPERLDLPDADLDFMSARRHEVIDYLIDKYGRDYVAGISNYTKLGAASALRDVGRVFDLSPLDVAVSKFIPKVHGQSATLEEAVQVEAKIANFKKTYPQVWKHAVSLEDAMRSLGKHAAGTVVGGVPLVERAVVERRKGEATINWDMRVCESQGLIKLDILGLNTLDVLELAREYVFKRHTKRVDFLSLPLDDEKVLKAFAKGDTIGVFQFESPGMRKLLRDLARGSDLTFEDIAAATALYRPGPIDAGLLEQYVQVKQGAIHESYDHPAMRPALSSTYGVMTYQEQVMRVARDLAGFSMPEADKLRKAIGKKDAKLMASMKEKFIAGATREEITYPVDELTSATAPGMEPRKAEELWNKIEGYAAYSFNRSHSVEYSLISYVAMWLKVYYPAEFFAAALTILKEEKLDGLIVDAGKRGISIVPPDINISTGVFEILNDTTLCIPFPRLKGISDNTTNAILKAREAGPFKSKDDLTARVERRRCNVRHVDVLDKVGAFARIESGSLPATHPDRIKDQIELMPGLVADTVPVSRDMAADKVTERALASLVMEWRGCEKCELAKGCHPKPMLGRAAKFMVITDGPTNSEEAADQLTRGANFAFLSEALALAGLNKQDAYWTTMVKSPKMGKQYTAEQVSNCSEWLRREIELLKPPLIVALGSNAANFLVGKLKGGAMEHTGKVIFNTGLDCNVLIGFNPAMIYFDEAKQKLLNDLFVTAAEILAV